MQPVFIAIRRLLCVIALCTSTASFSQQVCSTLTVTGPPQGPPSSWVQDGKLVGASVDFIRHIAKEAGVKEVKFIVYENWSQALEATREGQVDVLFSAAWSTVRSQYLNYIQPAYASQNLFVIVRHGERFPLRRYDDLKSRTGIAGLGESYGDSKFGQFVEKELNLKRSNNIGESFERLMAGEVDYMLAYENAALSEIFLRNLPGKVEIVNTFPYRTDTFITFSKRSKCYAGLADKFSQEIAEAKQDNLFFRLMNKYRDIFNQGAVIFDYRKPK